MSDQTLSASTGWPGGANAIIPGGAAARAASSLLHCQGKYPQTTRQKPVRPEGLFVTQSKSAVNPVALQGSAGTALS